MHAGEWSRCPDFCFWKFPLVELAGKTMGVVGFGRIGRAWRARRGAFGMKVLAYGPHYKPEMDADGCRAASLEELLAEADVISLNCPADGADEGHDRCRGAQQGQARRHSHQYRARRADSRALRINTARGALIDEAAVRAALDDGRLSYLCADVAGVEPIPAGSPLLGAPNAILTPHIAWAPYEARVRLMRIAEDNLRAWLAGAPIHRVN